MKNIKNIVFYGLALVLALANTIFGLFWPSGFYYCGIALAVVSILTLALAPWCDFACYFNQLKVDKKAKEESKAKEKEEALAKIVSAENLAETAEKDISAALGKIEELKDKLDIHEQSEALNSISSEVSDIKNGIESAKTEKDVKKQKEAAEVAINLLNSAIQEVEKVNKESMEKLSEYIVEVAEETVNDVTDKVKNIGDDILKLADTGYYADFSDQYKVLSNVQERLKTAQSVIQQAKDESEPQKKSELAKNIIQQAKEDLEACEKAYEAAQEKIKAEEERVAAMAQAEETEKIRQLTAGKSLDEIKKLIEEYCLKGDRKTAELLAAEWRNVKEAMEFANSLINTRKEAEQQ